MSLLLDCLPKFGLGERLINHLYSLLENLIRVRFSQGDKRDCLQEGAGLEK
nr:hypothetical protein [Roseofilum sp. SID1]